MTEQAKEARREYKRKYYAANKDKQAAYNRAYWERKAAAGTTQTGEQQQAEQQEKGA